MTIAAIGAALGIGEKVTDVVGNRLNESLAQRYNNEFTARITNLQNILNSIPVDRNALNQCVCECLTAAGYATTPVSMDSQTIEVPLADFYQLFTATADDIRKTAAFSSILSKK